jgi:hypothetical protein
MLEKAEKENRMPVLVIGEYEKKQIKEALESARAKPMPWELMKDIVTDDREKPTMTLSLEERRNVELLAKAKKEYPSYPVIMGQYMAAISFEEQPAGLMKHLSVSSKNKGMMPNEYVVQMICEEFGFSGWPPTKPHRLWIEEFDPGHHAINIIELEEPCSIKST